MYEVDTDIERQDLENIESVSSMWHYRVHISIEGVRQKLYEADKSIHQRVPVLQLFLKEVSVKMLHPLSSSQY